MDTWWIHHGRGHISVPKNGWPKVLDSFFFLFKILPLMDQSKVGHCKNQKNWTLGCSSQSRELIFFQICEVGGLVISLSLSLKMARWLRQLWVLVKEESRRQFGIPLIVWPYVCYYVKMWRLQNFFCLAMRQLGPIFSIPLHHLQLHLFCHQERKFKFKFFIFYFFSIKKIIKIFIFIFWKNCSHY